MTTCASPSLSSNEDCSFSGPFKAAWEKIQRGVAEFSITLAVGRPELFPELPARVQGFKPLIDACGWTLTKVTHSLSDSGYTTALELEMRLEDVPA